MIGPTSGWVHNLLMLLISLTAIILIGLLGFPAVRPVVSSWQLRAQAAPAELFGNAQPDGLAALERYTRESVLSGTTADQSVRFYRRAVGTDGMLAFFVVKLGDLVHLEVLNADGATPGSDPTGNTIWTDGGRHLQTVETIVNAPYATREGKTLLAAIAFGFHGDDRTSNEGTVVINGTIHRVNPGRATLCIRPDHTALIGLLDAEATRQCAQAVGAGPVILLDGKIANPTVTAPDEEFVPFNPLGEDFVQLDWRRRVYEGAYPKTAIGIGNAGGRDFLVLAVSYGITGVEFARHLREMGCHTALGGDDDSSTQAVWLGAPVVNRPVQAVPDALAVYTQNRP